MTDQATTTGQTSRNSGSRRTRRQLLVGGTGALAAAVTAETVARPTPASAANGDSVILGQGNIATATTHIQNGSNSSVQAALHGIGTGATNGLSGISERGNGVLGGSNSGTGVSGSTNGVGIGVYGNAPAGQGVYGQSGATGSKLVPVLNGVQGITDSPQGFGVVGENVAGGTAVAGLGGDFGVIGTSNPGVGVHGADGEAGVRGVNDGSGPGVHGDAFMGIGVLATGATALSVHGPAVFSRSGVLTVRAGRSSALQTVVPLSRASLVLATIQQDVDGVWVRSAVPDPAGSKFTVHLNKAAPRRVKVAWFVVN